MSNKHELTLIVNYTTEEMKNLTLDKFKESLGGNLVSLMIDRQVMDRLELLNGFYTSMKEMYITMLDFVDEDEHEMTTACLLMQRFENLGEQK